MEPSEESVQTVLDFCGLNALQDRPLVLNALKQNNGNTETVIGEFFEGVDQFRSKYSNTWQEQAFHGDRDGNENASAYHVEATTQNAMVDSLNPPSGNRTPGMQSRPPTRANSRSPLSNIAGWASEISGMPNAQTQQEDDELQRVLALSAKEAQENGTTIPEQVSGVVDTSTSQPYFGPATRDNYEQNSWAMTTTGGQETSSWSQSGPPSGRQRVAGGPAFLVQGWTTPGVHQLGGLLTILHQIPMARNALLSLNTDTDNYGYDKEWWNGQEILPPDIQARVNTGELNPGASPEAVPKLEDEIHRLMAFLDSTERAYGTVGGLTDIVSQVSRGAEKMFYQSISGRPEEKLQSLYQTAILSAMGSDVLTEEQTAEFGLLEMEHNRDQYAQIKTLYESLDHVLWNDALSWSSIEDGTKMAMFKSLGDVMVFKFDGDGPDEAVEIPLEFYPEKYLIGRRSEAARIQAGWVETKRRAAVVKQERRRLAEWRGNGSQTSFDNQKIITDARGQWSTYKDYLEGRGKFTAMEKSGFDVDKYPDYHAAPVQNTFEEKSHMDVVETAINDCDELSHELDDKLRELRLKSEKIEAKQRFLGRLLINPGKDRPQPFQCKKYVLRGVATAMDTVYVCTRPEPDLIELGEASGPGEQWWRCSRAVNLEQKVEKVEVERVLRDMWQESKTPLIVYATEDAMASPRDPLSGSLERFVKADNKAFRQELSAEAPTESTPALPDVINVEAMTSPSKRKHRADSIDSMNSNRPSVGSLDSADKRDRDAMYAEQFDDTEDSTSYQAAIAESSVAAPEGGDKGVPAPSTGGQPDYHVRITSPEAQSGKSPEMQERGRAPAFLPAARSPEEAKTSGTGLMDIDGGVE